MLKYNKLKILVIVSIIFGCVIFYTMMGAIETLGYMDTVIIRDSTGHITGSTSDRDFQYQAMFCIYIAIVLTIVVFIVYPILYLRKANKKRTGMI